MSRKILFRTKDHPYHINARVNNREQFPGELDYVWKTLTNELYLQTVLYGLQIHAFVLMPNHFHLLVTSPEICIGKSMQEFLSSSTRIINTKNKRSGRIFGARYFWSTVMNPIYYAHAFKYVYRNPVKAELCTDVFDYPYSTLYGLYGCAHLPLPIRPPQLELDRYLVAKSQAEMEAWLNCAYLKKESDGIRKALRRKVFSLPVDRETRRPLSIETSL